MYWKTGHFARHPTKEQWDVVIVRMWRKECVRVRSLPTATSLGGFIWVELNKCNFAFYDILAFVAPFAFDLLQCTMGRRVKLPESEERSSLCNCGVVHVSLVNPTVGVKILGLWGLGFRVQG